MGLTRRVLLQLLSSMLEESDDIPRRLLDTILGAIVPPRREENPGAATLAGELIRANEATLASHVQKSAGFDDSWQCGRH